MPAEDLNLHNLDLDPKFKGLPVRNLSDDDLLSIMQGAAEEIALCDYKSLEGISPQVIDIAYRMTVAVCGHAGEALMLRHAEAWEEE
jgi:hypothetical protein